MGESDPLSQRPVRSLRRRGQAVDTWWTCCIGLGVIVLLLLFAGGGDRWRGPLRFLNDLDKPERRMKEELKRLEKERAAGIPVEGEGEKRPLGGK